MAAANSVQKFLKIAGSIIGILVVASAVVAGVIETRVKVNYVSEDVECLEKSVNEHEGKIKVLERRTDDTEKESDRQGIVLDDIKDTLGELRTEQKVQGQYLKSFIDEYRRNNE